MKISSFVTLAAAGVLTLSLAGCSSSAEAPDESETVQVKVDGGVAEPQEKPADRCFRICVGKARDISTWQFCDSACGS